jgi:hypothetical protein
MTTLSINKLEKLLSAKHLVMVKFFVIEDRCSYIQILSTINAETFLLYIPSRFDIEIDKHMFSSGRAYKMDYIELNENEDIPSNYAGNMEQTELEDVYDEIDGVENKINSDANVEEQLEDKYKHSIVLQNEDKNKKNLMSILRQLKRFRLCVQNIKYKLVFFYKKYMCCIKRDDTIECYVIKNFPIENDINILVSIDLENFYTNVDTLMEDIRTVSSSIYKVINKNQKRHVKNILKMLEQHAGILQISQNVDSQKEKYDEFINQFETMLETLQIAKNKILKNIESIEDKYSSTDGIQNDIQKTHQISKLEKELGNISSMKEDIFTNIETIKNKRDKLMIRSDIILFDNNIMLDTVIKNLSEFNHLLD